MSTTHTTPRRPGRPRWASRAVLITPLLALTLTGCEESRFGMPDPATTEGTDIVRLWQVCFYVAIVLGALVLGLLFYSLVRHRRRDDELPKQTEGNNKLEFTYTVIPFILVALLFAYGTKVQLASTEIKKTPDLTVNVTGYQWNWRFEYPTDGVTVIGGRQTAQDPGDSTNLPEMVLPVDQRVRFNLVAADVAHSFFVPGFVTKRDLIPGVRNVIELTPDKTGFYIGHCAEYCGLNHSQMNFRVHVVSQAEYQTWLQTEKGQTPAS